MTSLASADLRKKAATAEVSMAIGKRQSAIAQKYGKFYKNWYLQKNENLDFYVFLANLVYWVGFGAAMGFKTHYIFCDFDVFLTFDFFAEMCVEYCVLIAY